MTHRISTRLLVESVLESPVGRITLSSYIRDSTGLPHNRLRVFGSYAAVYMLDGKGWYVDERGMRQNIVPGDLIMVFPEIAHAYGPAKGVHWDEIFIAFDGPVFDLWRQKGLISPDRPVLHLQPIDYWRNKWEQVVSEPVGPVSPIVAVGRLLQVLSEATESTQQARLGGTDGAWLAEARRLLDRAAGGSEVFLERTAAELGMSYVAFRKRFTALMGVSPGRYRARKAIDRTCQLMYASPKLANKEIARVCGFANEYHFSRRFKQIVGMTPTQFRSQAMISAKTEVVAAQAKLTC